MSVCNFCPLYKGAHSGCLQHDNPHFHHNLRLAALFAAEQEYFKTLAPGRAPPATYFRHPFNFVSKRDIVALHFLTWFIASPRKCYNFVMAAAANVIINYLLGSYNLADRPW